ncbi:hypothetical protein [Actinomadura atramentaria]|nr:hypothetical protein [Actinomadura atramentaria]
MTKTSRAALHPTRDARPYPAHVPTAGGGWRVAEQIVERSVNL